MKFELIIQADPGYKGKEKEIIAEVIYCAPSMERGEGISECLLEFFRNDLKELSSSTFTKSFSPIAQL